MKFMNQVNSVPKSNGMATTSMVLGILGIFFGWATLGILPLVAVILGHKSRGRIKRSHGQLQGEGKAIAGIVTGYVSLFLSVVVAAMMFIAVSAFHEYVVRASVSEILIVTAPHRVAIAEQITDLDNVGSINTNPALIGINVDNDRPPRFIDKISYDRYGVITIVLSGHSKLRDAAGKIVVLVPVKSSGGIKWKIDRSRSTVVDRYLPRREYL